MKCEVTETKWKTKPASTSRWFPPSIMREVSVAIACKVLFRIWSHVTSLILPPTPLTSFPPFQPHWSPWYLLDKPGTLLLGLCIGWNFFAHTYAGLISSFPSNVCSNVTFSPILSLTFLYKWEACLLPSPPNITCPSQHLSFPWRFTYHEIRTFICLGLLWPASPGRCIHTRIGILVCFIH